jgi:phosphoribosylaminoimidazolecarboxamide formyltransferase/IMP cyclohydrolase
MKQPTALLSVYNKEGIVEFAQMLVKYGYRIYSSGGTAMALQTADIPVTDVAQLVGGEAILGHRVVTLSREVHAGLLATNSADDLAELERLGVPFIDLVCVDLYPLAEEIAKPGSTPESVIEKTDIGGPTMLRSAAKGRRIVVGRPAERQLVLDWLEAGEPDSEAFRNELAGIAEYVVADYALRSASYTSNDRFSGLVGELVEGLKYGENAWLSPAGLYAVAGNDDPLAVHRFELVEGDARSLVGLSDVDSLLQVLTHIAAGFEQNFGTVPYMAVAVKHGNACGAAVGDDPVEVIRQMVAGDKLAIFGGVVMTNFAITREVAEALMHRGAHDPKALLDGVFGPSFTADAPAVLKRYQGKCRMMANPALAELSLGSLDTTPRLRQVRGGFLRQPNYTFVLDLGASTVHGPSLTEQQQRDIVLAWAVGSVSNSNTITLVLDGQLLANAVGQQDRVGACELAVKRATKAGHRLFGAVAWSDSFFPAPDGPMVLGQAGVRAIFTSSGSKRDPETIDMCKKYGVSLAMQPDAEVRGFAKH